MTPNWPGSLVLAGAGKMGGAMLRGWLADGLPPGRVIVADPYLAGAAAAEWRRAGVSLSPPGEPPEVLVLAVKPQSLAAGAASLRPLAGAGTLVISILAGTTLEQLRATLPEAGALVRAMPNLPASIGLGATGAAGEAGLSPARQEMAQALLGAVGLVEWMDESLLDAVTAVSGSGPAYVFLLVDCLAEAGLAAGLPADISARLARATIEGAAALMRAEPARSPAELRQAVTSPGGTTEAALRELGGIDGLAALMEKAVQAAKRRAGELASPS